MAENTVRILKQSGGIGHYFLISLAAEPGERVIRFAEGADEDIPTRADQ